jgi:peptidoglycan/LPS O-acetylase OafA/YrhL
MTTPAPTVFRKDIQALRALAVSFVVVGHLWPAAFSGGYVGVDVFFVISGFLITSHLLSQATTSGRVSLPGFWGNRAIRILPAAMLVLASSAIATLLFVPQSFWQQYLREIFGATIYVENWVLAVDAADYWAAESSASPIRHYWSLSVEEQFYIVMPLVLVAALQLGRRWRVWYGLGLGLLAIVSFGYSIWFTAREPSAAYFVTTTRVWEFAAGSLLALLHRPIPRSFAAPMAWAGLAMIVGAGISYSEASSFPGYVAAVPVVGALLVIAANASGGVLGFIQEARPVQLVGDISYAIYLWHWPLIIFAGYAWSGEIAFAGRVALLALATFTAWLSTRFFEDPIRFGIAKKPGGRRRVLGSIGVGMLAVLVLSASVWADLERRPRSAAQEVAGGACFGAGALITSGCAPATQMTPDALSFVKDNGNRAGCWATTGVTEPLHCTLVSTTTPSLRVAAIGDSHSNVLLPAFEYVAHDRGWSIDVYGKRGCYLTTTELFGELEKNKPDLNNHQDCAAWRKNLQDELAGKQPYDLLIVAHWEGASLPSTKEAREQESAGLAEAWKAQLARGTKIIALTDVPRFPANVIACIAEHQLEASKVCSVPVSRAVSKDDSNRRAAASLEGVVVLDTSRYFCTPRECLPVIGGVPVLFDRHHVTATYAKSMGPLLAADLAKAVVELKLE